MNSPTRLRGIMHNKETPEMIAHPRRRAVGINRMGKLPQSPNPRGICYTRRSIRSVVESDMEKEIFEKEISMCRKLCKSNKGEICESKDEVNTLKKSILQ